MNLKNKYYQKIVKENWARWRLLFSEGATFTYNEVFWDMTDEEIIEANVALDMIIADQKKNMNKNKK